MVLIATTSVCAVTLLVILWGFSNATKKINERFEKLDHIDEGLSAFVDFFSYPDPEDGLTAFDKSLNNLSKVTADRQANIVVASMRGQISAAARATEEGLVDQAHEETPELAMTAAIQQALPKKIAKNELAKIGMTNIIQKVLTGAGSGGSGGTAGGGNGSRQVKFKF